MNKQTRDIAVLLGSLALLGIVAFFALRQPAPPTPAAPPAASAPAAPDAATAAQDAAKKAANGHVGWLTDDLRNNDVIAKLAPTVKAGRDPFKDFRGHVITNTDHQQNTPSVPAPKPGAGTGTKLPFILPLEKEHVVVKTLTWITPRMLAKTYDLHKLAVTLVAGSVPGSVVIRGLNPDFDSAVSLVGELDIAPPVPTFELSGVVTSGAERYAALRANGHYYTVMEGEAIPHLGWRVTRISAGSVRLDKGKQTVQLRLSGGSPS